MKSLHGVTPSFSETFLATIGAYWNAGHHGLRVQMQEGHPRLFRYSTTFNDWRFIDELQHATPHHIEIGQRLINDNTVPVLP